MDLAVATIRCVQQNDYLPLKTFFAGKSSLSISGRHFALSSSVTAIARYFMIFNPLTSDTSLRLLTNAKNANEVKPADSRQKTESAF